MGDDRAQNDQEHHKGLHLLGLADQQRAGRPGGCVNGGVGDLPAGFGGLDSVQTLQLSRKGRQSAFGGQEVLANFRNAAYATGKIPATPEDRMNWSLPAFASLAILA